MHINCSIFIKYGCIVMYCIVLRVMIIILGRGVSTKMKVVSVHQDISEVVGVVKDISKVVGVVQDISKVVGLVWFIGG